MLVAYFSARFMPSAVIFTQLSLYFTWLNSVLWIRSFLLSPFCVSSFIDRRFFSSIRSVLKVMEMLHIDGQSIKFVDRKLWKRDSEDGKINFEGKVFKLPNSGQEVDQSSDGARKIMKKCPIEVDYPRKRRILKRPKRFKNYYSDREPLSIPSFSFPRCLANLQLMSNFRHVFLSPTKRNVVEKIWTGRLVILKPN